jgi:hypothetical protein
MKKYNFIYLSRFYVDNGNNLLGTNGTNDKYSRLFTLGERRFYQIYGVIKRLR